MPVTVIQNLLTCSNYGAMYSIHTLFEGEPHTFGITACDDTRIYVGLRVINNVLVYMEFESFLDFSNFFLECVMICICRVCA